MQEWDRPQGRAKEQTRPQRARTSFVPSWMVTRESLERNVFGDLDEDPEAFTTTWKTP